MRYGRYVLFFMLIVAQMGQTFPTEGDTEVSFSAKEIVEKPPAEMLNWGILSIEEMKAEDDRQALFAKIRGLPKVTQLRLHGCDLSKCTENDVVPLQRGDIVIIGGKVSQGTLRWLAKFPAQVTITFGCDLRGLDFSACKLNCVTFDNCELSRAAVLALVEHSFVVSFKEVTVVDEKGVAVTRPGR